MFKYGTWRTRLPCMFHHSLYVGSSPIGAASTAPVASRIKSTLCPCQRNWVSATPELDWVTGNMVESVFERTSLVLFTDSTLSAAIVPHDPRALLAVEDGRGRSRVDAVRSCQQLLSREILDNDKRGKQGFFRALVTATSGALGHDDIAFASSLGCSGAYSMSRRPSTLSARLTPGPARPGLALLFSGERTTCTVHQG